MAIGVWPRQTSRFVLVGVRGLSARCLSTTARQLHPFVPIVIGRVKYEAFAWESKAASPSRSSCQYTRYATEEHAPKLYQILSDRIQYLSRFRGHARQGDSGIRANTSSNFMRQLQMIKAASASAVPRRNNCQTFVDDTSRKRCQLTVYRIRIRKPDRLDSPMGGPTRTWLLTRELNPRSLELTFAE